MQVRGAYSVPRCHSPTPPTASHQDGNWGARGGAGMPASGRVGQSPSPSTSDHPRDDAAQVYRVALAQRFGGGESRQTENLPEVAQVVPLAMQTHGEVRRAALAPADPITAGPRRYSRPRKVGCKNTGAGNALDCASAGGQVIKSCRNDNGCGLALGPYTLSPWTTRST